MAIRVSGRVQGVYFRADAKARADELGLRGFARNEPDGSVYIEAEGPEENLQEFINWCGRGSPAARVSEVTVSPGSMVGYDGFEVRR